MFYLTSSKVRMESILKTRIELCKDQEDIVFNNSPWEDILSFRLFNRNVWRLFYSIGASQEAFL